MTTAASAQEAPARHVVEAIRRVMRDLPAIGKDGRADPSQGSYRYRGIEAITGEAQTLCAKHGVVFAPRVLAKTIDPITVNGKPWTDTTLDVEYDVRGPSWRPVGLEGPDDPGCDDRIVVGPLTAIGRDNSDKGANKAMTQAFKYALIQAFMISDKNDDADGSSHEADPAVEPPQWWQEYGYRSEEHAAEVNLPFRDRILAIPKAERAPIKAWYDALGYEPGYPVRMADVAKLDDLLRRIYADLGIEAATEVPGQAGEAPELPQEPSEPDAGTTAPEPLDEAGEAPSEPEPSEPPDALSLAIDIVKAMSPAKVGSELRARKLGTTGSDDMKRARLARSMAEEMSSRAPGGAK